MKTSRPAGQCVAGLVVVCCLFGLAGTTDGAAARGLRQLQESTTPQEFYFSEFMAESDEPVVLLEEGPFKLVASCQTISYSYSDWYKYYSSWYSSTSSYYPYSSYSPYSSSYSPYFSSYSPYSSSYSPYSSSYSPYSSSHSTSYRTATDPYPGSYSFDDDWSTDDYWQNGIHTDSIAALELTYTADDSDYLFGSPSYALYPFEETIIGSYEARESRTQIVFSGYDGGWSRDATLQSLSGAYFTTNGDNTIGFHIKNTDYHGNPDDYSFPEGIDCMIAGVIGYIVP